MKSIGLFEAKTKLSEICEQVSQTGQAVLITRRGKPLVRIDPVVDSPMTIRERRAAYVTRHADEKNDSVDFEIPQRSDEVRDFDPEA